VREANQAHTINELVNALKPDHLCPANAEDAPLHAVNRISTQHPKPICGWIICLDSDGARRPTLRGMNEQKAKKRGRLSLSNMPGLVESGVAQ